MKFIGFLIFVFIFLMAFWGVLFLVSVIPYFIYVWFKEGKLDKDQIPLSPPSPIMSENEGERKLELT